MQVNFLLKTAYAFYMTKSSATLGCKFFSLNNSHKRISAASFVTVHEKHVPCENRFGDFTEGSQNKTEIIGYVIVAIVKAHTGSQYALHLVNSLHFFYLLICYSSNSEHDYTGHT